MNFLFALIAALARMTGGVLNWGYQTLRPFMPWNWFGSNSAPPPPRNLAAILPDADEARETKDLARGQQQAVEFILSTPARQMQAWAKATPEQRDTIPLTLLNQDQVDWLETRSRDEIKAIAEEKFEHKVQAALQGEEDAIFGLVSCGVKKRAISPLGSRILAYRAGELERPPAYTH